MIKRDQQHITEYKRYVHYGTHPKSAFSAKERVFFILEKLYEMAVLIVKKILLI